MCVCVCLWVYYVYIYLCGNTHKDNQFKLKRINSSINIIFTVLF